MIHLKKQFQSLKHAAGDEKLFFLTKIGTIKFSNSTNGCIQRMDSLSNSQQQTLITLVYDYLQGQNITDIRDRLAKLCAEHDQPAKSIYAMMTMSLDQKKYLFTLLRIPLHKRTLYDSIPQLLPLLTRLKNDGYGHGHLDHLLMLIHQAKPARNWPKIAGMIGLTLISLGGVLYVKPDFFKTCRDAFSTHVPETIQRWLRKTFSVLRDMPLLGILYTGYTLFSHIYSLGQQGAANIGHKLPFFLIKALSISLTLTSYVLCFLAAGAASPLTAALFISSSALDIVESVLSLLIIRGKSMPTADVGEPPWSVLADKARLTNQQQLVSRTFWVKLFAAIIITALVAALCIYPPSLILLIGCIGSMMAVGFLKSRAIKSLHDSSMDALQASLTSLDAPLTTLEHTKPLSIIMPEVGLTNKPIKYAPINTEPYRSKPASPSRLSQTPSSLFYACTTPLELCTDEAVALRMTQ